MFELEKENAVYNSEDVCPICGEELDFYNEEFVEDDKAYYKDFVCKGCGVKGYQRYVMAYDRTELVE